MTSTPPPPRHRRRASSFPQRTAAAGSLRATFIIHCTDPHAPPRPPAPLKEATGLAAGRPHSSRWL